MNDYVHTRMAPEERRLLDELIKTTGESASKLVREGLKLLYKREGAPRSALDLCRGSVGKFSAPVRNLSQKKKHLAGYGE